MAINFSIADFILGDPAVINIREECNCMIKRFYNTIKVQGVELEKKLEGYSIFEQRKVKGEFIFDEVPAYVIKAVPAKANVVARSDNGKDIKNFLFLVPKHLVENCTTKKPDYVLYATVNGERLEPIEQLEVYKNFKYRPEKVFTIPAIDEYKLITAIPQV